LNLDRLFLRSGKTKTVIYTYIYYRCHCNTHVQSYVIIFSTEFLLSYLLDSTWVTELQVFGGGSATVFKRAASTLSRPPRVEEGCYHVGVCRSKTYNTRTYLYTHIYIYIYYIVCISSGAFLWIFHKSLD